MIIDQISELYRYVSVLPGLEKVVEILKSGVLDSKELGQYATDDKRVRYNVFTYETLKDQADEYEIHRREADVQILLSGNERMDIARRTISSETKAYDEQKDALMAIGSSLVSYYAKGDTFALFLPGEPHAPNLIDKAPATVKKVVFKILVD
ncbi:YhcH/YjgK/YiaL family protein [uncultured Sphaerochaeta sp.]|uniref:YhcH/YjgK/YiaL family protein n=1 Tax=uncultured Sphaerochaeta sp. TaxID=886478 RepID=UPI002A0A1E6A|nr:YhcH/YjgK/YiaL family protein [uncultured Sphaerochaeta sp.]